MGKREFNFDHKHVRSKNGQGGEKADKSDHRGEGKGG